VTHVLHIQYMMLHITVTCCKWRYAVSDINRLSMIDYCRWHDDITAILLHHCTISTWITVTDIHFQQYSISAPMRILLVQFAELCLSTVPNFSSANWKNEFVIGLDSVSGMVMGPNRPMQVTYIHTHPFNGPFSGTTRVSRYQKGTTNLDFTEARDSECSGISWAICKSAPCSRQTTTPAPHHCFFTVRMPLMPPNQQRQSTEGWASKHWRMASYIHTYIQIYIAPKIVRMNLRHFKRCNLALVFSISQYYRCVCK